MSTKSEMRTHMCNDDHIRDIIFDRHTCNVYTIHTGAHTKNAINLYVVVDAKNRISFRLLFDAFLLRDLFIHMHAI